MTPENRADTTNPQTNPNIPSIAPKPTPERILPRSEPNRLNTAKTSTDEIANASIVEKNNPIFEF